MGGFFGGANVPGQNLGGSQAATLMQFERNQLRKLGLEDPEGFAQQSANEVFEFALNSDNPEAFAEFFSSLDPEKTIASRFGIREDPGALATEDFDPDQVGTDTEASTLFDDPVQAAAREESRQARSRRGRSSTIKTSGRGITDDAETARPTLLGGASPKKKTLLGV